jgi:hypothetical protein
MDINQKQHENREAIVERLRKYEEEREAEEARRQLTAEPQNRIRLWLLVLKILFEIRRERWTKEDQTLAKIAAGNLQKIRLHQCDARDENERLLLLYEDYLKKTTAAKMQPQGDEDELSFT